MIFYLLKISIFQYIFFAAYVFGGIFCGGAARLVKFVAVTKQQIYDTSQNNPRRKQNHILRQRTQFVACDLSR